MGKDHHEDLTWCTLTKSWTHSDSFAVATPNLTMSSQAIGPFKLVTVNTAPERATRLVGRVADALKGRYIIQHVANCERIEQVRGAVQREDAGVLVSPLSVTFAFFFFSIVWIDHGTVIA